MRLLYLTLLLSITTLYSNAQVEIKIGELTSDTYFTNIDEARKRPTMVETLDLSMQKMKVFPEVIFSFTNCKKLILSVNYWNEIPEGLSELDNLEILNLSSNYNLKYLPEDIGEIRNLKELNLEDNMLMEGEVEMVQKMLPSATVFASPHTN